MGLLDAENTITSAPFSAAAHAVHKPAMPAPTITISCVIVSAISSSETGSGAISKLHFISAYDSAVIADAAESLAVSPEPCGAHEARAALAPAMAPPAKAPLRKFLRVSSISIPSLESDTRA